MGILAIVLILLVVAGIAYALSRNNATKNQPAKASKANIEQIAQIGGDLYINGIQVSAEPEYLGSIHISELPANLQQTVRNAGPTDLINIIDGSNHLRIREGKAYFNGQRVRL